MTRMAMAGRPEPDDCTGSDDARCMHATVLDQGTMIYTSKTARELLLPGSVAEPWQTHACRGRILNKL